MNCDENQLSDISLLLKDQDTLKDLEIKLNKFLSKTKLFESLREKNLLGSLNISLTLSAGNDTKSGSEIKSISAQSEVRFSDDQGFVQCGWILDANGAIIGYGCVG
jgi:hypothetical protein